MLDHLAHRAQYQGQLDLAQHLLEESLRIGRAIGSAWREGWALNDLAVIAEEQGDHAVVESLLLASFAAFERDRDIWAQAFVANHLAMWLQSQDDYHRAEQQYIRASVLQIQINPADAHVIYYDRAVLAIKRKDYAQALALFQMEQTIAERDGQSDGVVFALHGQVAVHILTGEMLGAWKALQQSLEIMSNQYIYLRWRWIHVSNAMILAADCVSYRGKYHAATRWLGHEDTLRAPKNVPLQDEWQADLHARTLTACRAALGDAAFEEAWAAGRALTLEQAVDEALRVVSDKAGER